MDSAKFWTIATAIGSAWLFSGQAVHAQAVPGFTDARLVVMNDARPRIQRENGMLVYDLAASDSIGRPKPGSAIPVMGYKDCNYPNGQTTNCDQAMPEVFLGPTIHAWKNQPIVVNVKNQNTRPEFLGPKVVHLHGQNTPQIHDGLPTQYILPNTIRRYVFPNALPSSTFWYHDHTMDRTHEFATAGLAGAFLLHDMAEMSLNLPKNDQELVLIIHTLQKDNYPACDNVVGTCVLVNGRERPYHDVKRQKYRLRVITASYYEEFSLKLKVLNAPASGCQRRVPPGETETSYYQIGSDGGFLAQRLTTETTDIAPAERVDLVVDFSKYCPGDLVALTNVAPRNGHLFPNIMLFRVGDAPVNDTSQVPLTLQTIPNVEWPTRARTITLTKAMGADVCGGTTTSQCYLINGQKFEPSVVIFNDVGYNTVERWDIINKDDEMHPVHVHLVQFRIVAINGNPNIPPALRGWKDTVAVPAKGSASIVGRYTDHTGPYVFHCHRTWHEDHAMMAQFCVKGPEVAGDGVDNDCDGCIDEALGVICKP